MNEFTCFTRINRLANMFAAISGRTFDESYDAILNTEYGREIAANTPVVMYEQTTENLRAIAEELGQSALFTIEKIVSVYLSGNFEGIDTARTNFSPVTSELKGKQKSLLAQAQERRLHRLGNNKHDAWKAKRPLVF